MLGSAAAQNTQPTSSASFIPLGQRASFRLPAIMNFTRTSASSDDFKGKLLILDFWSTFCAGCIATMPKIIELQKHYAGKVQFMGIGWDSEPVAQKFFAQEPQLRIPNAIGVFGSLAQLFGVPAAGAYVWIDAKGIVSAVTGHREITEGNIEAFLSGGSVELPRISGYGPAPGKFDPDSPLLINGNGIADIQYHSILTGAMPGGIPLVLKNHAGFFKDRRIIATNLRIMDLYGVAFGDTGVEHPRDIFPQFRILPEVADRARFESADAEHVYCYELVVPSEMANQIHQIMRDDLDRFFRTSARIEKRKVKAFVLSATGKGVVAISPRAPHPPGFAPPEGAGQLLIRNFYRFTLDGLLGVVLKVAVIDETGLRGTVDLGRSYNELFKKKTDVAFIRNALAKYGIGFQEAEREVEFLVIREKSQPQVR